MRIPEDRGKLLTGSIILDSKKKEVIVTIADVMPGSSRNMRSPLVIDFAESVLHCSGFGCNSTNMRALATKLGNDTNHWIGRSLKLAAVEDNNGFPPGIVVVGVSKERKKVASTSAAFSDGTPVPLSEF